MARHAFLWIAAVALGLVALLGAWVVLADFGSNWTATFYNNTDLEGSPVVTQTGIAAINFTWGEGRPAPGVDRDNWSARFTGNQVFVGGTYDFVVTSDDGVRVIIDGNTVWDQFTARPLTTDRFPVTLTPGTHSVTVEYLETGDEATLSVQWFQALPTIAPTLIPTFAPTVPALVITPQVVVTPVFVPAVNPTVPPPPPTPLPPIPEGAMTATVIRARVLVARSAPYFGAPVVDRLLRGQTYQVLGRDANARWFLLQLSTQQAWAYGYYLFINTNEFNAPVVSSFITMGNPAAQSGVVGQSRQGLRLRAAPTTESAQIGRIGWGDIMPIVGRTADNTWYQVIYKDTPGWVTSEYMRVVEGDVNSLPIAG